MLLASEISGHAGDKGQGGQLWISVLEHVVKSSIFSTQLQ
jgi:hypothetical protein